MDKSAQAMPALQCLHPDQFVKCPTKANPVCISQNPCKASAPVVASGGPVTTRFDQIVQITDYRSSTSKTETPKKIIFEEPEPMNKAESIEGGTRKSASEATCGSMTILDKTSKSLGGDLGIIKFLCKNSLKLRALAEKYNLTHVSKPADAAAFLQRLREDPQLMSEFIEGGDYEDADKSEVLKQELKAQHIRELLTPARKILEQRIKMHELAEQRKLARRIGEEQVVAERPNQDWQINQGRPPAQQKRQLQFYEEMQAQHIQTIRKQALQEDQMVAQQKQLQQCHNEERKMTEKMIAKLTPEQRRTLTEQCYIEIVKQRRQERAAAHRATTSPTSDPIPKTESIRIGKTFCESPKNPAQTAATTHSQVQQPAKSHSMLWTSPITKPPSPNKLWACHDSPNPPAHQNGSPWPHVCSSVAEWNPKPYSSHEYSQTDHTDEITNADHNTPETQTPPNKPKTPADPSIDRNPALTNYRTPSTAMHPPLTKSHTPPPQPPTTTTIPPQATAATYTSATTKVQALQQRTLKPNPSPSKLPPLTPPQPSAPQAPTTLCPTNPAPPTQPPSSSSSPSAPNAHSPLPPTQTIKNETITASAQTIKDRKKNTAAAASPTTSFSEVIAALHRRNKGNSTPKLTNPHSVRHRILDSAQTPALTPPSPPRPSNIRSSQEMAVGPSPMTGETAEVDISSPMVLGNTGAKGEGVEDHDDDEEEEEGGYVIVRPDAELKDVASWGGSGDGGVEVGFEGLVFLNGEGEAEFRRLMKRGGKRG